MIRFFLTILSQTSTETSLLEELVKNVSRQRIYYGNWKVIIKIYSVGIYTLESVRTNIALHLFWYDYNLMFEDCGF